MLRPYQKRSQSSFFTLDKVIAVLVLCPAIVIGFWAFNTGHYELDIAFIASILPIFYLIFSGKLSKSKDLPEIISSTRIRTISHIVFVISFSLSMWLLWSNLYYRPPLYFALLVVASFSIILDIYYSEENDSNALVALFKIVVLSLSIYGGIYYEFSGIYGVDPWRHNAWIQETVNRGDISAIYGQYYQFPLFHIDGAVTQILSKLSTYSTIFVSIGVFIAVSCIFVFLVGRKLFSSKVGLLAALIFSLTDDTITSATAIIPMSFGLCFLLAILYLVFCRNRKESWKYSLLIVVLSITLIFTHPIASMATLLSLITIYIAIKLYKQISKPETEYEVVSLNLIIYFTITMFLSWIRAPPDSEAFFQWNLERLTASVQTDAQFIVATPAAPSDNPFLVGLFNYLTYLISNGGYFMLLALAIVGSLIYLRPENRTGLRMAIILIAAVMIVIPRSFMLLHVTGILPDRWVTFLYIPISILGLIGLIGISNFFRSDLKKLGLLIVGILAILSITLTLSDSANSDSPLIFKSAPRMGYTQSEIITIKTLSDIGAGSPTTDVYYSFIFRHILSNENYEAMIRRDNKVFVLRNYFLNHPEWENKYETTINGQVVTMMDYLKDQGIDKGPLIYDNGQVKAYVILKLD